MIGLALTYGVALGLLGIGIGALLAPRVSAQQYGIVLDDARALAYIRAMGVRDLVLAVLLLLLASAARRDLLAVGVVASAAVAAVDFVVVSRDRPPPAARARLLHAGGALGLLLVGVAVASGL
jgi:hypothetical protein